MYRKYTFIVIGILLLVMVIGLYIYIPYSHEESFQVVINKVEMQQIISGSNNAVSTRYRCMVYTDKGVFEVEQSGWLYAAPEVIGKLHEGDTVFILTKGYDRPQTGSYRKIIDVR